MLASLRLSGRAVPTLAMYLIKIKSINQESRTCFRRLTGLIRGLFEQIRTV